MVDEKVIEELRTWIRVEEGVIFKKLSPASTDASMGTYAPQFECDLS